ncbi:hypothetical protein ACFY8S_02300 [Streptomyces hygroscopicus]|uniref:hypothetical protein n=1 Tax=Streptomyces hygroscopicus TaxID=1912 RepID=UPI0036D0DFA5
MEGEEFPWRIPADASGIRPRYSGFRHGNGRRPVETVGCHRAGEVADGGLATFVGAVTGSPRPRLINKLKAGRGIATRYGKTLAAASPASTCAPQ